jgi:cytochrome c2
VTIERLKTGERIRDIAELPGGKIVLWNGKDTLQYLESASYVFSECKGCHVLSPSARSIGPDLRKVVGRKVAGREGYTYSEAMRDYGGVWTIERLDAFLANPAQVVPGTSMQFEGVPDAAKRKEIIQFLKSY